MTDAFAPVPCPLPDCGEPLRIVWSAAMELWQQNLTTPEGIDVEDAHTSTWQIECLEGHVVAFPGPTGCGCDDVCGHKPLDYDWSDDNRTFRPHDAVRLGELIATMTGGQR